MKSAILCCLVCVCSHPRGNTFRALFARTQPYRLNQVRATQIQYINAPMLTRTLKGSRREMNIFLKIRYLIISVHICAGGFR